MIEKREFIESYFEDASGLSGGFADVVYIPENENEVSRIIAKSSAEKIPVTVSGGRTGVTGAAVPSGGIILSTEWFKKIEITASRAVVGAGVFLCELEDALKDTDFFYPPDPTEKNATLGGTVATDASGSRCFFYGRTRDYIDSMKIVLADGEIISVKRGDIKEKNGFLRFAGRKIPCANFEMPRVKNSAGYFSKKGMDLIDLFIGSEGTLGVICECGLRLEKRIRFTGYFVFLKKERVIGFLKKLKNPHFGVILIEYFDENSLSLVKDEFTQIPSGKFCAVFFETKLKDAREIEDMLEKQDFLAEILVADNEKTQRFFAGIRHRIPEKINEIMRQRGFRKISTDFATDGRAFGDIFEYYEKTLAESNIPYVVFGHIGENHLHINFLPQNRTQFARAIEVYEKMAKKVISLGGTVSAEHGIGKIKKKYLKMMYGPALDRMLETKKALDKNFILGRGNIFPWQNT
ncbi:MAG: FAD-binding oxidoreductase [Elusimicrobia bacterium]|nr:FAD-binding oxidoreductase [Elusimicrobiota bacterium]